ncbi:hypothetical protein [Streptomyces xanthophaeus]|uniref:hypothetical protein n=1 Tax=Streptomyces xanthophaeus TaxID=67385 RepID=UPI002647B95A|nr:hypothetical protein [Streptomyces xanthophaeus]WKD36558.1 hypothetical protein KO717_34570 [Streptomyces xanthophaeus]
MTPRDRLHVLRRLFQEQPGPIRTGMAHRLYLAKGIATQRSTARQDLEALVAQGLVYATGPRDNRMYWLRSVGGGR